jgi:hypothetical protein
MWMGMVTSLPPRDLAIYGCMSIGGVGAVMGTLRGGSNLSLPPNLASAVPLPIAPPCPLGDLTLALPGGPDSCPRPPRLVGDLDMVLFADKEFWCPLPPSLDRRPPPSP